MANTPTTKTIATMPTQIHFVELPLPAFDAARTF
jgi:hypothetical protein